MSTFPGGRGSRDREGKGISPKFASGRPPVRAGPGVKSLRTAAGRWDGGALCPLHTLQIAHFDRWSGACGWLSTASRFFFAAGGDQSMAIRVIVSGAGGKMGREVLRAVHAARPTWSLWRRRPLVRRQRRGGTGGAGLSPASRYRARSQRRWPGTGPTRLCVVDFTAPDAVYDNVMTALEAGMRVVFGTTGLKDEELGEIDRAARERGLGVIHAPNFAIGAVLMMRFAAEAAQLLSMKSRSSSCTTIRRRTPLRGRPIKTAELIREARGRRSPSRRRSKCSRARGEASSTACASTASACPVSSPTRR